MERKAVEKKLHPAREILGHLKEDISDLMERLTKLLYHRTVHVRVTDLRVLALQFESVVERSQEVSQAFESLFAKSDEA